VTLKEEYETIVNKSYNAEIDTLNFSEPVQASNRINHWVENVTHGLITSVVEPGKEKPRSIWNKKYKEAVVDISP